MRVGLRYNNCTEAVKGFLEFANSRQIVGFLGFDTNLHKIKIPYLYKEPIVKVIPAL
jgi:hypothetical protein